jgi:hypothetical protein
MMGKENKPARMNPAIKKALAEKSIAATGIQIDSSRPGNVPIVSRQICAL